MSRARVLLHDALRGPMSAAGWRPRARGWFSRPVDQGWLAVVSAGTAVEHSTPGEGVGHAHLSLRSERVEPLAAQLGGFRDAGYRQRTVVVMLSDPLPRGRSVTWHVSASTAVRVAEELAGSVEAHG